MKRKIVPPIQINHDECVIFGSGPSLDKLNIASSFFKDKDLIGCNFIHQHKALADQKFTLFSMIDRDYTKQVNEKYFQSLKCDRFLIVTKNIYSFPLWHLLKRKVNVLKSKKFDIHGNNDTELIVSGRQFVTGNSLPFLIQCAAFLAQYKTIYLFGVDHYSKDEILDDNNFDGYEGRKVKTLKITHAKLDFINQLYDFVGEVCHDAGVKIYNVTPGSKLETFEKKTIAGLVDK